jgi:hypothetical protein
LRPALVRLREAAVPPKPQAEKPAPTPAPAKKPAEKPAEKPAAPTAPDAPTPGKAEGDFSLESPD